MNAKTIDLNTLRRMLFDVDVPDSQIRPYVLLDSDNTTAFAPALKINWELVEDGNSEGDVALGFLNGVSRWRRQMRYRRKILGGWKGLKIVSEGDSWFQYPLLLDDVIDQIFERYAIYSLGSAGDHIADMIAKDEFTAAIRSEEPDVFLISGGGNDLVGDARLATMLHLSFVTIHPLAES